MLKTPSSWVGVNTHTPNKLVEEVWRGKKFFTEYPFSQGEVVVSESSRMDRVFWKTRGIGKVSQTLFNKETFHFVEVKSVTLSQGDIALFSGYSDFKRAEASSGVGISFKPGA